MVSSKKLPEIALQHLVFLYILSLHLVLTLSAGANGSSDIWLSLLAIPVCGLMVACACYYCHYRNSKRRGHERPQVAPVAPSPMLPPPFVNSASPPCQVQPLLGFAFQYPPPYRCSPYLVLLLSYFHHRRRPLLCSFHRRKLQHRRRYQGQHLGRKFRWPSWRRVTGQMMSEPHLGEEHVSKG